MHESTIECVEGLELNGCDAEIRESRISRIAVEGYDTSLPREDVDDALREHFASCGNIIHVHVPIDENSGTLCRYALIYVNKEDEEKALRLDGSDMGERILQIQSYPFHENHLENFFDPMKEAKAYRIQHTILVTCDDISLRIDVIKTELEKYFSAIGSLVYPDVTESGAIKTLADVYVRGHEGVEKALERSGPSVGGLNFVVTEVVPLPKITPKTGYIHPHNFTIMARQQIENQKKTETTAGNQQKKKSKTTERNQKKKNKKKEKKSKTREAYQKKKMSETGERNQKMKGVEISF
ncbi:unnamed protein product [Brassica napus]|uniref:(rape) hypothetical protein n=1 Tax=Brassica napus TaxID=3708 RepID=A0A816PPQ7_BRANA|nr:unnamed protein product [Brassica napus]